jgi:carbon monoxide dehydrogenase subunit G
MPEVIYSKGIPASKARIWEYVHDMDNWAPFIMGYKSHVKQDERHSTWTVKGELGVLARTVTFDVHITEWVEQERVSFTINGVTERFDGEGSFRIGLEAQPEGADFAGTRRRGGIVRRWFRKLFKKRAREARARELARTSADGDTAFSFALSMQAGGMTGPVVNAMIEPLMAKAADDLADKLTAEILRSVAGDGLTQP